MADGSPFGGLAEPASDAPSPDELAKYDLNDFGNAQRLIRLVGGVFDDVGEVELGDTRLLYLREVGWIGFNGRFWDQRAGEQLARRTAHKVAVGLRGYLDKLPVAMKDALKFADGAGSAGSTSAMLRQAESYLTVDFDAFDNDPLALNVGNGVLHFQRERAEGGGWRAWTTFRPGHRPRDRMTRMAAVDFDPQAPAAVFEGALKSWLPDAAMRTFVQKLFGYAATGVTYEQIFVIFHGLGRDGKSTLADLIRELLGTYASAADVSTFLDAGPKRGGDANADVARLAGDTRLVSTAEPPRGAKLGDNMIKSFTGGSPILARMLHKGFFEFKPVGRVFMECNALPVPQGSDEGIWRRLIPVPFEHQVPVDKVDKELPEKLRAELPGVLNWLIAGVEAWRREGLPKPERVTEFLDSYRKASSPFGEWWLERVIPDKTHKALASELYADFKEHFLAQGGEETKTPSQRAFGQFLNERQVLGAGKDSAGRKQRSGARLRAIGDVGGGEGVVSPGGFRGGSPSEPPAGIAGEDWSGDFADEDPRR